MRWTQFSKSSRGLELLVCCAALTACQPERIVVNAPPPPAEWLQCEARPDAPKLEPLVPFALPNGIIVYDKGQTDARDSVIARYILALRAAHFDCENALAKVRGYVEDVE